MTFELHVVWPTPDGSTERMYLAVADAPDLPDVIARELFFAGQTGGALEILRRS